MSIGNILKERYLLFLLFSSLFIKGTELGEEWNSRIHFLHVHFVIISPLHSKLREITFIMYLASNEAERHGNDFN